MLFDDRFDDSSRFADYARSAGASPLSIGDGISAQWYDVLRSSLSQGPGIIIGLTPEPMAFLIDVMARDLGHYQAFQGEHFLSRRQTSSGHRFTAPVCVLNDSELPGLDAEWCGTLVDTLSRFDAFGAEAGTSVARLSSSQVPSHDSSLVSWITAPLAAAN